MVISFTSLPALPLRNYIKWYCLREIDTGNAELIKPLFADDESILALALTDTPVLYNTEGISRWVDLRDRHLFGPQTVFNGYQIFKGKYKLLCIEFIPGGFYSLFNVPMSYIRNQLWSFDDVIGQNMVNWNDQLAGLNQFSDIVRNVDSFFLQQLIRKQTTPKYSKQVAWACHQLCGNYNGEINQLARTLNMSLRNFEQQFTEQVGMPPVLLRRVKRFQKAVAMKLRNPNLPWTSIAYDCNYYDQMHLIRDFKIFSSLSPSAAFRQMPPPVEKFVKID
ncbi:MAG: helix-turn-helix transcriptional regulator [Chitinophagaceae bacterium]|nr:helix-turn-helix transcriptional regulator [Chitinophagaceae bacterium]